MSDWIISFPIAILQHDPRQDARTEGTARIGFSNGVRGARESFSANASISVHVIIPAHLVGGGAIEPAIVSVPAEARTLGPA
jgi:hypothetical protein